MAHGRFDLTYLIDGVLAKDPPAGLVAPKKSLKTNIGIDLAIALATGGRFLGYFRVAELKRMAMFSGESGMATIQETAIRISKAAGVSLQDTGIIFSDTVPRFGDPLNMSKLPARVTVTEKEKNRLAKLRLATSPKESRETGDRRERGIKPSLAPTPAFRPARSWFR